MLLVNNHDPKRKQLKPYLFAYSSYLYRLDSKILEYEPSDLSSNSVAFDLKKLDWINGVYIRKLNLEQLKEKIKPFVDADFPKEKIDLVLPLIQERLVTLADFNQLTKFFYGDINYESELLLKKAESKELVITQLEEAISLIKALPNWTLEELEKTIRNLQEQKDWHRGQFFMMLRIATTGEKATPPLFETMIALGKNLVLVRLREAIEKLN